MRGTAHDADPPLRVLLVGERESGKTTCCMSAAKLLRERGVVPGGVVCPKLWDKEGRVAGIEVMNILSEPPTREVLARTDRPLDGPCTGAYNFSQNGLQFGREALEDGARNGDLIFADELGPLELRGEGFSNLLELARALSTPPMIIVVRTELASDVCRELAPISATVVKISPSNRDETPAHLLDLLHLKLPHFKLFRPDLPRCNLSPDAK